MTITVKYFASLRERLARGQDEIPADGIATVADVWRSATHNAEFPPNALMAVNMDYAQRDDRVKDGDEVAFFPPVTGG